MHNSKDDDRNDLESGNSKDDYHKSDYVDKHRDANRVKYSFDVVKTNYVKFVERNRKGGKLCSESQRFRNDNIKRWQCFMYTKSKIIIFKRETMD